MFQILLQRGRWLGACFIVAIVPACVPQEENGLTVARAPEQGERFFSNLTQLTFGGQNAEAYFAPDGESLIFQRTDDESLCDQQYVIGLDGSGMERVSNGLGRTILRWWITHPLFQHFPCGRRLPAFTGLLPGVCVGFV
jgi:hypothetical protein